MALQQWALPQISKLLPLDEDSLKQIITYSDTLPEPEAAEHLRNLLGDSPQALEFVTAFNEKRSIPDHDQSHPEKNGQRSNVQPVVAAPSYAPPAYPPPAQVDSTSSSEKNGQNGNTQPAASPSYAPPAYPPPTQAAKAALRRPHTNAVIEAAHERARDEVRRSSDRMTKLRFGLRILTLPRRLARNATIAAEPSVPVQHLQ